MLKIANAAIVFFCLAGFVGVKTQKVVQVDVSSVFNSRPVTVLNNGKLFTWTTGIDGGGKGDGYLTMKAALFNGDTMPHALPDDAVFSANSYHPLIKLHYSGNDTVSNQTCNVKGEGSFGFDVPQQQYSGMYLCLTSSEGPSKLHIILTYTDGSEMRDVVLPDYYNDIAPGDNTLMYVAHDLAKWNNKNKMAETDHHNIDAVNIRPGAKRVLKHITVNKEKAGYLVFWGATGVVAD